ncbi:MAG: cytochrome c family protein [Rhodospirillaceae bacterium]
MKAIGLALAVLAATAINASAAQAGDAEKGKKVFNKCRACHAVDKPQNRVGPHLVGVVGRKAGSVDKFRYSEAMKNAGIVWDDKNLSSYLEKPRDFVKGNRMAFPGLKDAADRDDVIAYLRTIK